jgi:hypothetical protein
MDAALALDRLDQHRRRTLAHGQRPAARRRREAGHERRERRLLRLLRRRRQRPHRAAVETALEHHEVTACAVPPRELDRALDRLGARVAEEDLAAERPLGQPRRQPPPRLRVEEVADVH